MVRAEALAALVSTARFYYDPAQLKPYPLGINSGYMFHEIEAALKRLVGTRLTNTGSAADLQWFTFSRANELDLSLHVSCPWRVTLRSRILLGDDDYRRPASPDTPEWEYESGTIGSRWRHVQTDAVQENARCWPGRSDCAIERDGRFRDPV